MEGPRIRRTERAFEGADGRVLLGRSWLCPEPQRALAVVHGLAEHSGRYERFGAWFARRGCAVHAYDQRGHGRSDGRRCHVDRFDELLDDLDVFLGTVREQHRRLPVALVGHSMGGLVVAAYVRERHPEASCAVTSGAALALGKGVPPLRLAAARGLRRLAPRFTLATGVDPDALSRDPEVVRRYVEDPLVHRRLTTSLAWELLEAVRRTAGGGAEVKLPMLLLHGAEDRLCSPAGSRAFYASLNVPGSDLRVYPELRHEIFNEPEQEEVFRDLLDWVRAQQA